MSGIFIGMLGVGKGTWGHVLRILSDQEFDKIVLIATDWVKENFKMPKECDWIIINNRAGFEIIKEEIKSKLPEGDLVVSIASGSGKEHMALISAIKELDRPFKFVTLTGNGVKYY